MASANKTAIPSVHGDSYREAIKAQYMAYVHRKDPDISRAESLMSLVGFSETQIAEARIQANVRNVDLDAHELKHDMQVWAAKNGVEPEQPAAVPIAVIDDCTVPSIESHSH